MPVWPRPASSFLSHACGRLSKRSQYYRIEEGEIRRHDSWPEIRAEIDPLLPISFFIACHFLSAGGLERVLGVRMDLICSDVLEI